MKRLLSLILAMMLVCTAAAAETHVKEQGLYRYRVKEDGTAEITGVSENIQDGNIPAELDGYKVTSIGSFAFDECSNLKEVRIPEGVTAMLPEAFIRCRELTSVSIPDSMVDIGGSAETGTYGGVPFMACPKLETIEISPDHPVFMFADHALINRQRMALVYFANPDCTGTYEIPRGIKTIEAYAFYFSKLTSVIIPDSVVYIGHSSFSECENLKDVVIAEGVRSIDSLAFAFCNMLESVNIPDSVTEIGPGAFNACDRLTAVQISPDHPVFELRDKMLIQKEGMRIVSVLSGISGKYEIPEGIVEIWDRAFQYYLGLKEIIIPDSVTSIGAFAFYTCYDLQEVYIPGSVTEIGKDAFRDCSDELLIKAPAGSAAEKYCEENGIKFEAVVP